MGLGPRTLWRRKGGCVYQESGVRVGLAARRGVQKIEEQGGTPRRVAASLAPISCNVIQTFLPHRRKDVRVLCKIFLAAECEITEVR